MDILTIILAISTVAGGLAALQQLLSPWVKRKKGVVSWKIVEEGAKRVIKLVKEDEYFPEIIVGLGRAVLYLQLCYQEIWE